MHIKAHELSDDITFKQDYLTYPGFWLIFGAIDNLENTKNLELSKLNSN